ncbi:MAG: winged helix-turn-helix domain-containing protein [Bacteroidales bacterium]
MITNRIESNANLLIKILIDKERMALFDLFNKSQLNESEFYITIGWLLREGKVFFLIDARSQFDTLFINDIGQNWVYVKPYGYLEVVS